MVLEKLFEVLEEHLSPWWQPATVALLLWVVGIIVEGRLAVAIRTFWVDAINAFLTFLKVDLSLNVFLRYKTKKKFLCEGGWL